MIILLSSILPCHRVFFLFGSICIVIQECVGYQNQQSHNLLHTHNTIAKLNTICYSVYMTARGKHVCYSGVQSGATYQHSIAQIATYQLSLCSGYVKLVVYWHILEKVIEWPLHGKEWGTDWTPQNGTCPWTAVRSAEPAYLSCRCHHLHTELHLHPPPPFPTPLISHLKDGWAERSSTPVR